MLKLSTLSINPLDLIQCHNYLLSPAQEQEQLEKMKKARSEHHEEEIQHHEDAIEELQEQIARHKAKIERHKRKMDDDD